MTDSAGRALTSAPRPRTLVQVSCSRGRVGLKLRKVDEHYVWPKLDKLDGQLNALARPSPMPYMTF